MEAEANRVHGAKGRIELVGRHLVRFAPSTRVSVVECQDDAMGGCEHCAPVHESTGTARAHGHAIAANDCLVREGHVDY